MNIAFDNKRVLVTGGCEGIGREICLRLSKYKGTVIALSNNKENLKKLAKEHPEIKTVCVDFLDWGATKEAVKSVLPIDLLVNCAGITILAPCLALTEEECDLTFGLNFKAILNVSQVVAQNLIDRKVPGSIVNISSTGSKAAYWEYAVYGASKSAVNMLTKSMALELGPNKIRVNCVLPTVVMTELARNQWSDPEKADLLKNLTPLHRFAARMK
ncbi:L-xylulose reductase-like [Copidosoma floridanum]|uniref:L-xylulose reductase-like n=1 Tax=Copidosoma floridanum TaxID=29053 RepID=UPI0006C9E487|nr:L-xylulose reductase-like [Copidosoma floridanum]